MKSKYTVETADGIPQKLTYVKNVRGMAKVAPSAVGRASNQGNGEYVQRVYAQVKEKVMNYSKYLLSFVAAFALLLPSSGFAKVKNSGTMVLTDSAKIGNTELQPGTYRVEWDGTGSNVNINIIQHKSTVATVQGELKANDNVTNDAVVVKDADNNAERQISEIDFGHSKQALVISSTQQQMGQ